MKKIILVIALLVSFISNAQIHNASGAIKSKSNFVFTNDDYIGYWACDDGSPLVIWKDTKNNMQLVEFSNVSGDSLDIIKINFNKTNLYIKINIEENNSTSEYEFTFVDKNTLACTVIGEVNTSIIYKKIR